MNPGSSSKRFILRGMLSFTVVSLAGFAVWAFGGRWFYRNVGEAGLYAACTIVFIGLAGLLMHPLIVGENRVRRFYLAFVPAFLAYAFVWSGCWFALKFGAGEWLGSLLGCAVFAIIVRNRLRSKTALTKIVIVLFVAHSAGYFAGGRAYEGMKKPPEFLATLPRAQLRLIGPMLWGLFYGLGFGAGIGYAFYKFQRRDPESAGEAAAAISDSK